MPSKNEPFINKKYGKKFQDHLLEQYKLFVESAEKISMKRMGSNKFYLTVISVLFGVVGYLSFVNQAFLSVILAFIGIFLCWSWKNNISSYKELNGAKFKIIHELEEFLPARIFTKEDKYLRGYYRISHLEKYIPILFIVLYAVILIIGVIQLIPYFSLLLSRLSRTIYSFS